MKTELVDKWIEALESGEYSQCQSSLRDGSDHSYCCLGVLADVAGYNDWEDDAIILNRDEYDNPEEEDFPPCSSYCTDDLSDLIHELRFSGPAQSYFIKLNDTDGLNFEQIAQHVKDLRSYLELDSIEQQQAKFAPLVEDIEIISTTAIQYGNNKKIQ